MINREAQRGNYATPDPFEGPISHPTTFTRRVCAVYMCTKVSGEVTRPWSRVITDAGAPPEPMTSRHLCSPRTAYRSQQDACVAGRIVTICGPVRWELGGQGSEE
ncbi:hypothetical protein WA026_006113 [Henosepilachna vigintioctopunctata]|uniref:Uncharacterized protein n=1 Tax=Henosepilachna vigintioctopunctata TaxID=420089 RepID=A0AAW1TNP1_9CUCU